MPLFRLTDVQLAFGSHSLLDKVSVTIHAGERIGLLGRDGAGKSTFLKLLAGTVKPDGGEVWLRPQVKVATLEQELPRQDEQTVWDYVAGGLAQVGELLKRYHHLAGQAEVAMDELARVQKEIEVRDGWLMQQKVETMISTLDLPAEQNMSALSGGWLRRVALARTLVREPDVLLLDEPTNHLDIPTIEWLEKQLRDFRGAIVLITHDRAFLQKIANQIWELDRGRMYCWRHDYRGFLVFREQQLAAEEKANQEFDKKLAQEETWIRQGIKARRTRNEGRVRALERMRAEFGARRKVQGGARISLNQSEASGKIVVEAEHVVQRFGDRTVIRDFSTVILRGDKVGLIGPNGAGKSTLLKILLGELTPTEGKVKTGSRLEVAYFDQMRGKLDPDKTVIDNLAEGREYIDVKGKPKHVMSYLQDFLFAPDRVRQPVKSLSGGEQNRLILAQLFSKPANVLVLDEPTNDLDMETLELLEEILLDFDGTLLLVSHDRAFLDNVVSSCIVFEGDGKVGQYVGGYQDWLNQGGSFDPAPAARGGKPAAPSRQDTPPARAETRTNKLSYKMQRELEQLPGRIEETEKKIAALEGRMSEAGFYQREQAVVEGTLAELQKAQAELEALYERWSIIEEQQGQ